MTRDYYEVLGVKPGATEAEIRAAYKRLAKKHHPDMNPGSKTAEESFKAISEAYQVLGDPQKRREYDQMRIMGGPSRGFGGAQGPEGGPFGPGSGFESWGFGEAGYEDLGGIFSDLFGRAAAAGGRPRRGGDLEYEASIDFAEGVRGTTITVPVVRNIACPACGGSGSAQGGRGPAGSRCRRCGGEGVQRSGETMSVRIHAGAQDGSRVRVPGGGDVGRRGGPSGDLYIVLRVRPHRYFRREGDDIVLDVPLSYAEAALGARVEVPTLEGRASLTIPPGTPSGRKFRLRGKGVPRRDGSRRGDQIVVVSIVPPRKVDARMRELLREMDRLDNGDPRGDLGW